MTIKTFAQIDRDGNCNCVLKFDSAIEYGDPTGDFKFVEPPEGVDAVQLMESYKWNGEWKFVGCKPSKFHYWSETGWEFDMEAAWREVKTQRSLLLGGTDWTQLPDVPEETRSRYTEYRQALRDITNQLDPTAIVWPLPPK